MRAKNKIFHLEYFRCVACEKELVPSDEFALRDNGLFNFLIFLLTIFLRLFGTKCDKCHRSFGKNDFVMRAKNKIFHLECFRCVACEKQLVPGDEFALRDDGLFCREDHQDIDRKDSILDNNNTIIHHNASNSSEDNSEGMKCSIKGQLISERNFGVFKSPKKTEPTFRRISVLTSTMGLMKT